MLVFRSRATACVGVARNYPQPVLSPRRFRKLRFQNLSALLPMLRSRHFAAEVGVAVVSVAGWEEAGVSAAQVCIADAAAEVGEAAHEKRTKTRCI